jgi:hypothetical protein
MQHHVEKLLRRPVEPAPPETAVRKPPSPSHGCPAATSKFAQQWPRVSHLSAVPRPGTLPPRPPTASRRRPLYLHFGWRFKGLSQDDEILDPQIPNCRAVYTRSHSNDHIRRRHCERVVPEAKRNPPTTAHLRVRRRRASRQANVKSASESGHTDNAYISVWCTSGNDPNTTFAGNQPETVYS